MDGIGPESAPASEGRDESASLHRTKLPHDTTKITSYLLHLSVMTREIPGLVDVTTDAADVTRPSSPVCSQI